VILTVLFFVQFYSLLLFFQRRGVPCEVRYDGGTFSVPAFALGGLLMAFVIFSTGGDVLSILGYIVVSMVMLILAIWLAKGSVRQMPEISFRHIFRQGGGSSTEEVSFVRYMPSLIIFTAILSVIFLLFGVDPSAVFVAVGVSALGFSAAVYLLSKKFGKITKRSLNVAVSAYFTNIGWQAFIAKALFTGEPWVAIAAVAFMAFFAFYMPYDLAKLWIREETQRSLSRS
jgi:hypothetical protein